MPWLANRHRAWRGVVTLATLVFATLNPARAASVVSPNAVTLRGPEATQQLLVRDAQGVDLTRQARYEVTNSQIVRVDVSGLVEPVGEGQTLIRVHVGNEKLQVPVVVSEFRSPQPVSFREQIIPILTKASCNSGGCHGKAEGQNGFKLTVFGFDTDADYQAIVEESRGRRLLASAPEASLLLQKATGRTPHGGGKKIPDDSLPYKRLLRWIAEGARLESPTILPAVRLEVEPHEQILRFGATQQLRVTAIDATGQRRCVTAEAEYDSNMPSLAGVDRRGLIQSGTVPGEAAILVRAAGLVTTVRIILPRPGVTFTRPPEANAIDGHVWNKLKALGIPPSDLASDSTFLRRVYLDTIGTLPTAAEARQFLQSTNPQKRSRVIDQLLERPEYADYWAMKWADLLRVDRDVLTAEGAVAMSRWLRQQFAVNRPYDQWVRDIVTAEGRWTQEGPAGFFRVLDKPEVMSRSVSQLFLGVRIECAQCHHHPSERWGQEDYYALAGFFTGVTHKNGPQSESLIVRAGTDLKHPRTGQLVPARALGAGPPMFREGADRRQPLADWMVAPENPYFTRAIVNRLVAHYLGRGLIEPIDDLRTTNPASNEPLLAMLSQQMQSVQFDLKKFTRFLLNSRSYQLGPAIDANRDDTRNFSHARPRSLPAEVLLDAISQTTGVPEKFNGWPLGVRAIQMWDNRMPSYFLKLFGRPVRASVCECERSGEPSISQALHLMNAPEINAKIHSRIGVARRLAASDQSPKAILEELTLGVLTRFPTPREHQLADRLFAEETANRQAVIEDLLWTMLNTREFVLNH